MAIQPNLVFFRGIALCSLGAIVSLGCSTQLNQGPRPSENPAFSGNPDNPASVHGDTSPSVRTMATSPAPVVTLPSGAQCAVQALPTRRIGKLTDVRYRNAVKDLVGTEGAAATVKTPGVGNDLLVEPVDSVRIDGGLLFQYQSAAESLAAAIATAQSPLFPCAANTLIADNCVETWIGAFVGRAFRRPLQAAEIADYKALFEAGTEANAAGGVKLVVQAALQSPWFLYATELGAPGAPPGATQLSDDELAAQLSFWLLDSPPDEQLRLAATAGTLSSDPMTLVTEARRLLASAHGKARVVDALSNWFQLKGVLSKPKDPVLFPNFPQVKDSLLPAAGAFLDEITWSGDFMNVYTSTAAFVDPNLATLVGAPAPAQPGLTRVSLPATERQGILTQPAFLARFGTPTEGQIVQRGLFVRREALCQKLSPPPPGLDVLKPGEGLTERQFADFRATQVACAGCHAFIDPFGLMFSHYDTTGAYHESEMGTPIDASGVVTGTDFDGTLANAVELSQKLSQSATAEGCVVTKMFSWGLSRVQSADGCTIEKFRQSFAMGGHRLDALLTDIAASDDFRLRVVE